jgi:hypothetical protein
MRYDASDLGQLFASLNADEVAGCYVVQFGSALFANDGVFVVLETFDGDVAVLSDTDPIKLRPALLSDLAAKSKLFYATAWTPPWAWRKRILRVFPSLSVKSGTYPKWQFDGAKSTWQISRITENGETLTALTEFTDVRQ